MNGIAELITKKELIKNQIPEDNEYLNSEGLPHCKICDDPKYFKMGDKIIQTVCSCYQKNEQRQLEKEKQQEKLTKLTKLKEASLLGKIYKNARFDDLDANRDNNLMNIVERSKKYVSNFDEIKELGQGIYIYGDVGTGKSYLTACIGNALLEKGESVLFTNFSSIDKMIKDTFRFDSDKTESEVINDLTSVDLLIIDDLGTEKNLTGENTFLQEKVYDVINYRYISKKATIFTSNYSLNDLYQNGVEKRTIDRISEMSTAVFEVRGQSYRRKIKNKALF